MKKNKILFAFIGIMPFFSTAALVAWDFHKYKITEIEKQNELAEKVREQLKLQISALDFLAHFEPVTSSIKFKISGAAENTFNAYADSKTVKGKFWGRFGRWAILSY